MSAPRASTEASATPRAHPHGTGAPAMPHIEKVCFDRVLPAELARPLAGRMLRTSIGRTRAAFQLAKLGHTGSPIRLRLPGGSSPTPAPVQPHAGEWAPCAHLEFGLV